MFPRHACVLLLTLRDVRSKNEAVAYAAAFFIAYPPTPYKGFGKKKQSNDDASRQVKNFPVFEFSNTQN
jgi:hypothetical protein